MTPLTHRARRMTPVVPSRAPSTPRDLACMCEECNLGLASEPLSLRMMARVLLLRRRMVGEATDLLGGA